MTVLSQLSVLSEREDLSALAVPRSGRHIRDVRPPASTVCGAAAPMERGGSNPADVRPFRAGDREGHPAVGWALAGRTAGAEEHNRRAAGALRGCGPTGESAGPAQECAAGTGST